jgi:hypothetical protein
MGFDFLQTKQTNEVGARVERAGFDPREFTWRMVEGDWAGLLDGDVPGIVHTSTDSVCAFAMLPDRTLQFRMWGRQRSTGPYGVYTAPGEDVPSATKFGIGWPDVLDIVSRWLGVVSRNRAEPDFWAGVANWAGAVAPGGPAQPGDDAPFTVSDRTEIASALQELSKHVIATYRLTEEQGRALNERLARLDAASERMGRKDWKVMLIGTIGNLVLDRIIPMAAATYMWEHVLPALTWLAAQGHLLP